MVSTAWSLRHQRSCWGILHSSRRLLLKWRNALLLSTCTLSLSISVILYGIASIQKWLSLTWGDSHRLSASSFVALWATIIWRVFKFIINSVGLRPGLPLYLAAIDIQNITQMVALINLAQCYVQLSVLISVTSVAWRIPKSMIFVDTINDGICIATYLRNELSCSMAEYHRKIIRPYDASLEFRVSEEYLNVFKDGKTRVLVCTNTYHITWGNRNMGTTELCIDSAGMGVDIPDKEVIMQWKISLILWLQPYGSTLVRLLRILRLKPFQYYVLTRNRSYQTKYPKSSMSRHRSHCIGAGQLRSPKWIKYMYVGVWTGNPRATAMHYHCVDQPILLYQNTTGYQCWCVMAIFLNYNVF